MKIIKKVLIGIFFLMVFLFYNVFQFTKLHLEKNKEFNIIKLNRTNIKLGHRLPNAIIIGTPRSGSKVLSGSFNYFIFFSLSNAFLNFRFYRIAS